MSPDDFEFPDFEAMADWLRRQRDVDVGLEELRLPLPEEVPYVPPVRDEQQRIRIL